MVATPAYRNECAVCFADGLAQLAYAAGQYGVGMQTCFLGQSIVQVARNRIVHHFLASDAEHLMFIDADTEFKGADVLQLLVLQMDNPEFDIIGSAARVKDIDGHFCLRRLDAKNVFELEGDTPIEVAAFGTAFMLIRRSVFERFAEAYPTYRALRQPGYSDEKLVQYFHMELDSETGVYESEDYWFCKKCRDIGIKIWVAPWIRLGHQGTFIYR